MGMKEIKLVGKGTTPGMVAGIFDPGSTGQQIVTLRVPRGNDLLSVSVDNIFLIAESVMTGSDLEENDPRLKFLRKMRELKVIPRDDKGKTRYRLGKYPT
jgi:hypothetical protein